MAPFDADGQLLSGLLALQAGLVEPADLVEAFAAWERAPGRPLAEFLVARGALGAADQILIDDLARRHVARHGGGPSPGEATSEPASTEAQARVAAPPPPAGDHTAQWTPGAPAANGQAAEAAATGRFRVLRPHARGGLGEVFVALDAELNREVALKQILDDRAGHPESRARFRLEAEVTGRLEHPGVVPVYGLGRDAAGRPYYAMRFIRGETLREAIAALHRPAAAPGRDDAGRDLLRRRLLRRFLDVCDTIAFAHSRGVVHRDLKPANIMLGPYGETLVLDWGLAKLVGAEEGPGDAAEAALRPDPAGGASETRVGTAMGTLGYMSPEQAEGRAGAIGPATDIFGLGATLACLLTGTPHQGPGAPTSTITGAQGAAGLSPPPRLDPRIPRPLAAVVAKAMAPAPADRYPTARALAEDIERWQAGEPVSAWREPWWMGLRRRVGRHQRLAAAVAAAVVVAAAGLAASTAILGASARREAAARARAEGNLRLAEEAVDRFCRRVSEDPRLRAAPLEPLRRDLLQQARDFYASVLKQEGDDPRLRAEQARVALAEAWIAHWLDEWPRALESGTRARVLLERLTRDGLETRELAAGRAEACTLTGVARWGAGDPAAARDDLAHACTLWGQLAARFADEPKYRHQQAICLNRLGKLRALELGDPAGGAGDAARSLAICAGLRLEFPGEAAYASEHAQALGALGEIQLEAGDGDRAVANMEAARRLWLELVGSHSDRPDFRAHLADASTTLAAAHFEAGRPESVRAIYDEAAPLVEELVRAHPDVRAYRVSHDQLAAAYAQALAKLGDHSAARRLAGEAVAGSPASAGVLFLAACTHSLASDAAGRDDGLAPAERARLAEGDRNVAMGLLERLRLAGAFRSPVYLDQLRKAADFDPLRGRDEFLALIGRLEREAKPGAGAAPGPP